MSAHSYIQLLLEDAIGVKLLICADRRENRREEGGYL